MPFASIEEKQAYQRDWYAKNRKRVLQRKKKNRAVIWERMRAIIVEAKKDGCSDCKDEFRPWVLQFDHVRGRKLGNIADMVTSGISEARFRAEIAKCDVVCANCHCDRTHRRSRGVA